MDVTIGILSYNTKDLLLACLNSIQKYTKGLTYEIIVVDNASKDGSAQMIEKEFPSVKLIKNKENRFFAAGYNQIISIAKGKYFIMLNSDTYLENNSFKKILAFMKRQNVFACEGLEVKPNDAIISTGSHFRFPLSDFYELSLLGRLFKDGDYINIIRMRKYNRKKSFEVDVGCNAYFCIETNLLRKIGGYDENFTLYYTEDDICQRVKKKGYKIFHCGESYIVHEDAKSTMQLGARRIDIFYKDMLRYHLKYNNVFTSCALFYLLTIEYRLLKIYKKITG